MTEPTRSSGYRFGIFELLPSERRLLTGGEPVVLGPRAFNLLVALTRACAK
jgi:DNA-binding winged helix-turn-helix (wHTH) protein